MLPRMLWPGARSRTWEQLESRMGTTLRRHGPGQSPISSGCWPGRGFLSELPKMCGSSDLDSSLWVWCRPPGVPGKSCGLSLLCRVEIKTQKIPPFSASNDEMSRMQCDRDCLASSLKWSLVTETETRARPSSRRMAAQGHAFSLLSYRLAESKDQPCRDVADQMVAAAVLTQAP